MRTKLLFIGIPVGRGPSLHPLPVSRRARFTTVYKNNTNDFTLATAYIYSRVCNLLLVFSHNEQLRLIRAEGQYSSFYVNQNI